MCIAHVRPGRKTLSVVLCASLLIGAAASAFPAGVARAETPKATKAPCVVPTGGPNASLFLPMVSGAQNPQAAAQAAGSSISRRIQYEVGKRYVYEWNLRVDTKTVARDSEGTHDKGGETLVLHAFADVSITGQDANGSYSGQALLREPYLCNTDGTNESTLDNAEMVNALKVPITFTQAPNGTITSVSLPEGAPPQVTNLQKGIINALQLTLREDASTYAAEEKGGQGTYTAQYTVEEQGDQLHVTKSYDRGDFTKLVAAGDSAKTLTLDSRTQAIIDGAKGVPTAIETVETIATGSDDEPANAPENGYAGATVWSKVNSLSKFTLKEVLAASNVSAAAAGTPYVTGDLSAVLVEPNGNRAGIDWATVDLGSEFAALESNPADPDKLMRILDLADADPDRAVLDKIQERLQVNAGNTQLAKLYVDILTAIGTPQAQQALNGILGNAQVQAASLADAVDPAVKEQALIDLVLLASPTMTTVNTVAGLSKDAASPLQETAIAVLGGTVANLADENPDAAESLAAGLIQSLSAVTETTDVQLYLDALGNTGLASTLGTIVPYATGAAVSAAAAADPDQAAVRATALTALRKIPGEQAEQILIAAISNNQEAESLRLEAASALMARPELSEGAAASLQGFLSANLASPGLYRRTWYSKIGGEKLGVEFPGGLTVASPPSYSFFLYGYQKANGIIWGNHFNVVTGEVSSERRSNGQFFGAYLSLANNRIRRSFTTTLGCSAEKQGSIWQGSLTLLNVHAFIPVAGIITVDLDATVAGSAAVDYRVSVNTCNQNNASASATITPRVWATATGEASLSLVLVRGGAGIQTVLLNTSLPSTISTAYNGSTFRFCGDIKVAVQPLSGRLYGFADVGVKIWFIKLGWKRVWSGTIWEFATPAYSYTLWNSCS